MRGGRFLLPAAQPLTRPIAPFPEEMEMYEFNYQRNHLALKDDTPSEHGKKSAASYAGKVSLVDVDDKNMPTRKMDKQGDLK